MRIKYINRDFKHSARAYVYVYAYVYVRVHIHAHTKRASTKFSELLLNDRVSIVSGCSELLCSCLLGVRARTVASKNKPLLRISLNHELQMIVAASCGTKNNNASLQSNN